MYQELFKSRHILNKEPYKLSSFLKLRRAPKYYAVFCQTFVRAVTGKKVFDDRFKNPLWNPDHIFTVSDEAFALVTLENHWDRWEALFKHHGYDIPPTRSMSETKKRKQEEISETPRYTCGGITYADTDSTGYSKGWSAEGLNRFNDLFDSVEADRESHPNFNAELCASARAPRVHVKIVRKKPSTKPKARFDSFTAFEQKKVLTDTSNFGEIGSTFSDDNMLGDPSNDVDDDERNAVDQGGDQAEADDDAASDLSSAAQDSTDDEGNDENAQVGRMAQV